MQIMPTFYFSLRSPYSWLALHDLRQGHADLLATLRLVPFWEPDSAYQAQLRAAELTCLYTPMTREKHLYILRDVSRLAARRGLRPAWPLDGAPRWEVPHLAWVVADAAGMGLAFLERTTDARWQEGLDICDPRVMAAIATELGLDARTLSGAHADPEIREVGLTHLKSCIDASVFGVPFFSAGREAFWGIDRLTDFVASQEVPASSPGEPADARACETSPSATVFDHAGGCG